MCGCFLFFHFFFFFQAEDGIRDDLVTGVQTCALPISGPPGRDDGGAWASAVSRRRARPRRPGDAPAVARPSWADRARRPPRHRADALPLRDDRPEGRDRQLPLVLPDPAVPVPRAADRRRRRVLYAPFVPPR